jgi:hypothetical protein
MMAAFHRSRGRLWSTVYLVHAIYQVTAVHELLANILLDVAVPTTCGTKVRPIEVFRAAGCAPQMTVPEWFNIVAITSMVGTLPKPQLVPEMAKARDELKAAGKDDLWPVYETFVSQLQGFSQSLQRKEDAGHPDAQLPNTPQEFWRDHSPFSAFDPSRLEVSVSI